MPDAAHRLTPPLPLAALVAVPGLYLGGADYLGWPHPELSSPLAAVIYGIAIVGAAFILSWAAEAAQVDINGGLALALLAFLAVLPEYAVDFVFTMRAGLINAEHGHCMAGADGSNPCSLALANMTGANRILVGIGWPLVVLVATLAVMRARRRGGSSSPSAHVGWVKLPRRMSVEVFFLGVATLYSLHFPLRHSLTLVDAAVLVSYFVAYAWRLAKAPVEEPDHGYLAWVGSRPVTRRWLYSFIIRLRRRDDPRPPNISPNLVGRNRAGDRPVLLVMGRPASESPTDRRCFVRVEARQFRSLADSSSQQSFTGRHHSIVFSSFSVPSTGADRSAPTFERCSPRHSRCSPCPSWCH